MPECVVEWEQKAPEAEPGEPQLPDGPTLKGLRSGEMIPCLVNAIKELEDRLAKLEP